MKLKDIIDVATFWNVSNALASSSGVV